MYSYHREKIPNSFSGTTLNRHRTQIESGEDENNFSKIYFFLPAITDRSEEINQYLRNVSIFSIDITQEQLNVWVWLFFAVLLVPRLIRQSLIFLAWKKIKCLMLLLNTWIIWTIFPIVTLSGMLTAFFLEEKLTLQLSGLARTNREFCHKKLKSLIDFYFRHSL